MKRKIVFIINPIAGTRTKESLQYYLEKRTTRWAISYKIIDSNPLGNYDKLLQLVESEKITDVVVCGGDGTLNPVATALIHKKVNIGIIPVGSGNGLARAAGLPMKPSKALDIIFAGNTKPIDGFFINGQFSCMLCGLGFDAQIAHNFAKLTKRGLVNYAKQTMLHFIKASAYPFEVEIPGLTFNTDAFFISIANSNQFGNNFTIAPKASLSDGLLDIVIVQKMNKIKLLFKIAQQIKGDNQVQNFEAKIGKNVITYFQVPELKIKNLQHAPLHIDGDPKKTATEFTIKIVPHALRLLMPVST